MSIKFETNKPCKGYEYSLWLGAEYKKPAKRICREECEFILECLKSDRIFHGEPGIRAGLEQDERHELYIKQDELDLLASLDLSAGDVAKDYYLIDFAVRTSVARALNK